MWKLIAVILCVTSGSQAAIKMDLAKAQSKIEFLAVGRPSMLKIRGIAKPEGEAKVLEGSLSEKSGILSGKASFALSTLDTGIALRNRHMKEKYLETAKFPNAELALTELKLPKELLSGEGEAKAVPFQGTLTVHGVPKPVSGKVDVRRAGSTMHLSFEFGTKITGHGIELPSFMGVTVAEDVQVLVSLQVPIS